MHNLAICYFCKCIHNLDFKSIAMPPIIRKRGRPKGSDKTIIGLPKKKKKSLENKPLPFLKKTPKEREEGIF